MVASKPGPHWTLNVLHSRVSSQNSYCCHGDIFSRLGQRPIRGQPASWGVPLRNPVRILHFVSLKFIWWMIGWSVMVSTPDSRVQNNVWDNISVSLAKSEANHFGSMLWWNLSAPCRLSGEVWLCGAGVKQQLSNGTWRQNKKGLWVSQLIAFIWCSQGWLNLSSLYIIKS